MGDESQFAPRYVAKVHRDSLAHIVVGVDAETLCNRHGLRTALQVPPGEPLTELAELEDDGLCTDCRRRWENVEGEVNPEPVETCHVCETLYSGVRSRTVDHMSDGEQPVCKPCYERLYEADDSAVTIPYEEAEPFVEIDTCREFDQTVKLIEDNHAN